MESAAVSVVIVGAGLTQAQLDTACVDDRTALPADLGRPAPCTAVKEEA